MRHEWQPDEVDAGRVAAAAGLGALLFTVGCGGALNGQGVNAQQLAAAAQPGTPVVVSCEPNQRTLVRPTMVNGAVVSQVECVSTGQPAAYAQPFAAPVSYRAARAIETVRDPELEDARVIPASYPVTTARPVRANQVVYGDDRVEPVKRSRSVKKSAGDHRILGGCRRRGRRRRQGQEGRAHRRRDRRWRRGDLGSDHAAQAVNRSSRTFRVQAKFLF